MTTISVLIRDGFRACFGVLEVVPTILHLGDIVAVLSYIGEKRLYYFFIIIMVKGIQIIKYNVV